ncbi:MAG: sugar phosphate isomerase/epimerase [Clostridia bacterium]|nr:sugar phosphate isomerase/epimerase [Clostridia bacterium]MBQ8371753.1 sugar phosphate isomerase/epimerase [Clostridia bacterium]
MGRIIFSAFSDEYSRDVCRQTEALRTLGFTHMEPRFIGEKNIADLTEEEARELRRVLDEAGISVSAIGSPIGKISIEDDFEAHLALAERTFRTANILGAKNIRMFSFYFPKDMTREQCRDAVIERIGALLDLADRYGVTLCHENEAKIYGETPEYCLDLLRHFGGRLRCVFDMGNFVLDGCEPYPHAYELLSDYIEYFHIKDSLPEGAIVPPGLGKASIREILAAHKARGGDFIITLEPHLQLFSGLNALTDSRFENPYKFETQEEAFIEAARLIKDIVNSI